MSDKRDRIIAAALKLFCENGFQNTSTATISKEAGVATGTLFVYFKSKDELINTLYLEAKHALALYFQEDLPEDAAIKEKLFHFWEKGIDWAVDNQYQFRFFSIFSNSPFISNLTREEAASAFQFTQELVEQAKKEGSILPLDTGLLISLFSNQLNAVVTYIIQNPNIRNTRVIIKQTFDIFWKGVQKD
jgi:AcrR family transcriptional regulator